MSRAYQLTWFFVLAYGLSWLFFIPLAIAPRLDVVLLVWFHFAGAFGPLLAAFLVTARVQGSQGVRHLLRRMVQWQVGAGWMLVALLSPVAAFLAASLVLRLFTGSWLESGGFGYVAEFPALPWWAGWIMWTLTFGLGEETGWRGFALPRLQAGYSARTATLILGLLWAGWHLPTFFYNYSSITVFSLTAFVVSLLSGAVVLTFLVNSTHGSFLVAILWHGALNTATAGSTGLVAALVSACVILAAVWIGNRFGPQDLSAGKKFVL